MPLVPPASVGVSSQTFSRSPGLGNRSRFAQPALSRKGLRDPAFRKPGGADRVTFSLWDLKRGRRKAERTSCPPRDSAPASVLRSREFSPFTKGGDSEPPFILALPLEFGCRVRQGRAGQGSGQICEGVTGKLHFGCDNGCSLGSWFFFSFFGGGGSSIKMAEVQSQNKLSPQSKSHLTPPPPNHPHSDRLRVVFCLSSDFLPGDKGKEVKNQRAEIQVN